MPGLLLVLISWAIVAFGQPAWVWWSGVLAATIGYAIFWSQTIDVTQPLKRFWMGTLWMASVYAIQLSWTISHPYWYILIFYVSVCLTLGAQFGLLSLLVTRSNLSTWKGIIAIAGFWTLMEWSRLFILSGFSFNPTGLALTTTLYSLQLASFFGVFGLTFIAILTNAAAIRVWMIPTKKAVFAWVALALSPYLIGGYIINSHLDLILAHKERPFKALLVQPSFPIEEAMPFPSRQEMIAYALDEWKQLHQIVVRYSKEEFDVVALPEFVVPFFAYSALFPYQHAKDIIVGVWGKDAEQKLPPLKSPWAMPIQTQLGTTWWVNHAFFSQAMSNLMGSPLVVGLEDYDELEGRHIPYSAALYFKPHSGYAQEVAYTPAERYEKRVLVPMGEYIPFTFLAELAASYGVTGSFINGNKPKVFDCAGIPVGVSICYEETFGDLTRENRVHGAELLLNLTNDCWYPNSRLPQQHFDHARLRTVESGIPLLRSCNTGVTGAIDSLGRVISILGEEHDHPESISDALSVEVSRYHYQTLYSRTGDLPVIAFSFFCLVPLGIARSFKRR